MKQKRTLTIGAIVVAIIAVLGLSAASYAATGVTSSNNDNSANNSVSHKQNAQQFKAKFQAIKTALDNNDYQAWLQAVGPDSKQAQVITADKFPRLVEAEKIANEGRAKLAEANKIREDLGLEGFHDPLNKIGKLRRGFGPGIAAPQSETAN
jgi:hypothetical protein